MSTFTRRDFLAASLAGLTTSWSQGSLQTGGERPRLAVSTWSLHNYFPGTRYGNPRFKVEDLKLPEVLTRAQQSLGLDAFELSSAHLESWEPEALDRLKSFAQEKKIRFIHLSDNIRGINLARADKEKREEDLRTFEKLLAVAQRLGIPTMRVNTGKPETREWDLGITIDCYKRLATRGKELGVEIVIENHFGLSADPKMVKKIIDEVGLGLSSCPDFGLLPAGDDRWPGLETMLDHARRVCSAKFHGFDEMGNHRDFDLKRCYDRVKARKFTGWVMLEYEGPLEPLPQLVQMKKQAQEWLGL